MSNSWNSSMNNPLIKHCISVNVNTVKLVLCFHHENIYKYQINKK